MRKAAMEPTSKASRCLSVLEDGPATTGEVAVELGISPHNASSHLHNLLKRKKVCKASWDRPRGEVGGRASIWSLPLAGDP